MQKVTAVAKTIWAILAFLAFLILVVLAVFNPDALSLVIDAIKTLLEAFTPLAEATRLADTSISN